MASGGAALKNAWTGGQYSLVRALACGTMAVAIARSSIPQAGAEGFDPAAALLALVALLVAVGLGAGARALSAILATAVSVGAGEGIGGAAAQYAGLWLSLHILVPRAPYGSAAAAGREDPRGSWSMPAWQPATCLALFVLSRLFCSVHALYDGNQVMAGIFFFLGMLALSRSTALVGWSLSAGLGIGLALEGHGSLSAAWFLHLFTFQPAWIPPRDASETSTVFYDGSCALCHGVVRFLLAEDAADPPRFRIAPLRGEAFTSRVTQSERTRLPDSVVVARGREMLVRSAAVIAILDALGGLWWMLAAFMRLFPTAFADTVYDFIAARRYRWFGRRSEACPLMPAALRGRIDP